MDSLRFIDLFAGLGGFHVAMSIRKMIDLAIRQVLPQTMCEALYAGSTRVATS